MPDANDMDLVREYAARNSEPAFETLVRRHVSLVYSVALRQVGNPVQAEEITQAVFLILARKAARLRPDTVLAAWLHETARFASASFLRGEQRRRRREQEAYMQSQLQESAAGPAWEQLAPLLDEAIDRLGKADRDAVVLRFFQNKSAREIAAALNVHESAAQKRLHRAVEKLRAYFRKRGVTVSAGALIGVLSVNSVSGAPAHLAASVMAVSAKGTAVSTSTLTLIKGALKIMAWTKAKTAIVVGVSVLLAAGTTIVTVKEIHDHWKYSWEVPHPDVKVLEQASPQITILPAKFLKSGGGGWAANNGRVLGISVGIMDMLEAAYATQARMVIATELPRERYDFIASLPNGTAPALQAEIKRRFGLVGRLETIETNVLVLTVKHSNVPGLKPNRTGGHNNNPQFGEFSCVNQPISALTYFLELYLGTPVVDRTDLAGGFDMDLKWDATDKANRNVDGLKQALLDQLGLELVPAREPVEMLMVEKAK